MIERFVSALGGGYGNIQVLFNLRLPVEVSKTARSQAHIQR
jgi:hypothetical protein